MTRFLRTGLTGIASVFMCGMISACSRSSSDHGKFIEPPFHCQKALMRDQFIVRWKSGEVTVVKTENFQSFYRDVLLRHEAEILRTEHDYLLHVDPPEYRRFMEGVAAEAAPVNWGVERIGARALWERGEFGAGMVVAVIDSGIWAGHPQLQNQILVNDEEMPDNGVDDDGNGYVDDVNGWDFRLNSPLQEDPLGHGTYVAGIVAARHETGEVLGVAPRAKILPLNFMNEQGSGSAGHAAVAVLYAAQRGAHIINASWGGAPCSNILQEAIAGLRASNVIFVNAAGNNGNDIEVHPEYPAALKAPTQLTVGASTFFETMALFSNKSRKLVDLVAPGEDIVSTVPAADANSMKSGTSAATPFVAGAAALIWAAFPEAGAEEVIRALRDSVDPGPYEVETGGRLNVPRAVDELGRIMSAKPEQ